MSIQRFVPVKPQRWFWLLGLGLALLGGCITSAQNRTAQNRTAQDRTAQDRTAQDRTAQDGTEPDGTPLSQAECEADPDFVFVAAGEFIAGSDRTERDYGYAISAQATGGDRTAVAKMEQQLRQKAWFEGEDPRQTQTLDSFCLGRNLVTNADYQQFIQATGHRGPGISEADYQRQGFLVHPYAEVEPYLWQDGQYPPGEGQHPVVLVSYEDALAYATWKGQQDDRTYHLPSAAEWEKAARGTEGRYFPWGNDWREEATNAAPSGLWHTSAVGTFPLSRSVYGVEDMAGNVFEFTATLQPRDDRTVSVMKGCSWDDLPGFCRGAYRHTRPIDSRHILFGFRLVLRGRSNPSTQS